MADSKTRKPERRLIYKRELLERYGCSYVTLWNRIRRGEFPKGVYDVAGRVAWWSDEVEAAEAAFPKQSLKGEPPDPEPTQTRAANLTARQRRASA